jgi:threonine dehydratase
MVKQEIGNISTLFELRAAHAQTARFLHRTPLIRSATLSKIVGCNVFLKQELLQKTGSYKPRGLLWALQCLSSESKRAGVITFSAGNAGQGLAYAGGIFGIPVTVVMPALASPAKAAATRDYGAEVILHGTAQQCLIHCQEIAKARGLTFVHSYDNPTLMAGYASLGLEILDDLPDTIAIYVGIGGGGMAGGLAAAAEALGHDVKLIGVEPTGAPAMHQSLAIGKPVTLESVNTVADGLAPPSAGSHCLVRVQHRFEEVMLVEDDLILEAMRLLMTRCKLFAEPAGSAALAGLIRRRGTYAPDDKVVCIVSGGNLDLGRLATLL